MARLSWDSNHTDFVEIIVQLHGLDVAAGILARGPPADVQVACIRLFLGVAGNSFRTHASVLAHLPQVAPLLLSSDPRVVGVASGLLCILACNSDNRDALVRANLLPLLHHVAQTCR